MSPLALSVRSKRPCTANSSSMWSRNGSPVRTLAVPAPSSTKRTCTFVSFVRRARRARRAAGISAPPQSRAGIDRLLVIAHALVAGDRRAGAVEPPQIAAHRHAAGPAYEVLDAKGRCPARRPAGRQGMIRSRDIVAERDSRTLADEHRAGVTDVSGQRGCAATREQHVLWRGSIRGAHRGEQILRAVREDTRLVPRGERRVARAERGGIVAHERREGAGAVFRLRE